MPTIAMMTIPTVLSILPLETAAKVEPPSTQSMTPKPAMVARLSSTMIDIK